MFSFKLFSLGFLTPRVAVEKLYLSIYALTYLKGKFLVSQSIDGKPYKATVSFNLSVERLGKYEINFALLMYCNQENCDSAQDYIEITNSLTEQSFGKKNGQKFFLKDLDKENKWILKKI